MLHSVLVWLGMKVGDVEADPRLIEAADALEQSAIEWGEQFVRLMDEHSKNAVPKPLVRRVK